MGHNYHMPDPVRAELQRLPQCMAVFYYRDGEYQFLLCTDHFCQVLNLSRETAEEYFYAHSDDFFYPDDVPAMRSKLVELVRNPGVIYPFRIRLSCAGGYKWFNGNMKGVALEDGGTLIYASTIDITDDHNRHRKDKVKDILMSRVLDTTQNCMFWKDTERRFVGVNQAFLDFYGFPSEDVLVGKTDEDMGWHLDPEPFKQDELRVLQGESTYMVHGHCLVHGENRDILASKTPAWDGDEIIGFVGSFMDVTDSYRQQQQIRDLSRELEASLDKERQLNVEMNHFLSRLSHELRTPMNAVIGLSTLGMEQDSLEGALNYLDKIRTSGHYLLQIINEVLEMNKVEAGDIQLNIESASLHDIIKDIHTIIDPLAAEKGISLTLDPEGLDYDRVLCDKMRVEQILVNLLQNAVKFTERGGRVSLKCYQHEQKGIADTFFTVEDNGCGISPQFLPKMFRPFAQENKNPSKYGSGTGLGLTISRTFARMMDGDITVESRDGEGSVFRVLVRLEVCDEDEGAADGGAAVCYDALAGKKILLAEDNLINQEVALGILARVGIHADLAGDGADVLEKFAASPPFFYDAVLMDIQMPRMTGFEAAEAIRSLEREDAKTVPVIAMSADIFEQSVNRATEAGMSGYLTKPLDMDVLYRELLRQLRLS